MSVDNDEIEKAIDEIISKSKVAGEGIKKQKTMPFRYLTNAEEIKAELNMGNITSVSVMKTSDTLNIVDEKINILGMGDVETIEGVVKRHEMSRKFKD